MQRILQRGEIESLDHTTIPRWRQPVRAAIFSDRAARLQQLAAENAQISGYLQLMAQVAAVQNKLVANVQVPGPDAQQIDQAQTHGMPPLHATAHIRHPSWQALLKRLVEMLLEMPEIPPAAHKVMQGLLQHLAHNPAQVEAWADALLAEREDGVDAATAPFVMAALQVYWTALAADFDMSCLPVASIVHVGGRSDGCRYLCCSLCSAEWHLVRVTCSHCQSTKGIAYHSIEGGPEGIKAESCDTCHVYRKIFYQEKVLGVDAVADDLASLMLDMLMGEAGYTRASGNPLLWHDTQASA